MENNIVSYIMENLLIFLPIGITGIVVTIILLWTGEKETSDKREPPCSEDFELFEIKHFNVFDGVYFFIILMLFLIGVSSDFVIPSIVGFLLALIPLILKFLYFFVLKKLRKKGDIF